MPIAASEIQLYRSASTGSLGGARTTTAMGTNLFDSVTGEEAAAGRTEYRCVFVANLDPLLAFNGTTLSVQSDSTSTASALAVGVGAAAMNGTEPPIAVDTVAPSGVTFGTSANLGSIPAGQGRSVWIRRTVTAGAPALQVDAASLRVAGSYTE